MVRYTVAMCNYNMVETLERSVRSVLDQVTDEYEVLVVDGGSDDGSVAALESLADEHRRLRTVFLDHDPHRHLGRDRQVAVEEARGEYVLPQLDVDDVFEPVVRDFVGLYHQFDAAVDGQFFLSGTGMNVAPRSLLLETPYRNLRTSEDRDLWRRLLDRDAILWLAHAPVRREIGYGKSLRDSLSRDFSNKVADAQCGLTLGSCLRWSLGSGGYHVLEERRGPLGTAAKSAYDLVTYPVAFLAATNRQSFETPTAFRRRGRLEAEIAAAMGTVADLERRLDVTVDRSRLSDRGRELLCIGHDGPNDG